MRLLAALAIALLIPGSSETAVPKQKRAPSKAAPSKARKASTAKVSKRKPAKRRPVRRRAYAPKVTPLQRAAATGTVNNWLSLPGTIENPAALIPFYEQLYRLESGASDGVLRVLQYGDSHTAADDWPGTVRMLLQERFGDGGPGFLHAGRPWTGYRHLDTKSWSSNAWYSDGLAGRAGDGRYGISGVSMSTSKPGEMVTLEANCELAELHFLRQPGGGTVEISDNGVVLQTASTEGEPGAGVVSVHLLPGSHLLTARTMDSAPVRLLGWVVEKSHGVTYEMMGVNGAQANIGLSWDEPTLAEHYVRRPPALIVLAYGTNEARSAAWTHDSYREMFLSLLDRYRRLAPTASILVIGPPDHFYRYRTGLAPHQNLDAIVNAQREAALSAGAAFWDLRSRMGGKGAMRLWQRAGMAQPDYVHFTSPGYRLLGAALYKELMGQFSTYVKVRAEPADGASSSSLTLAAPIVDPNGQTSTNQ